ncbi:hypothetical protein AVT69_gp013 [Pseudomonas phage PhiPA3]|uniref:Uncharacterized protein 013 n=1 Tax=Pseudomonas phage PhiPA3 TaxID=998086 RepID=F8SJP4_BPPA3|nr:hypothetical protein AVT69_gp013 [Pseudomonas phage PhiPA3]AEH03439.1 hypothetical protein [Pseudomonas phage PhiPA3]
MEFPLVAETDQVQSTGKTPMATGDATEAYRNFLSPDVAAEDVGLIYQLNTAVKNDIATLDQSNQSLVVEAGGQYA